MAKIEWTNRYRPGFEPRAYTDLLDGRFARRLGGAPGVHIGVHCVGGPVRFFVSTRTGRSRTMHSIDSYEALVYTLRSMGFAA